MTKKKQKNKINYQKKISEIVICCAVLCIALLYVNYLIFYTNLLKPKLNEVTTNYISFNNSNTTDMLKVSNLKKMSDKKGKSNVNKKCVYYDVTGDKGRDYNLIIYPINNNIDLENVNFYLTKDKKEVLFNSIKGMAKSKDDGIIIYQGKVGEKNMSLCMWLSKDYSKSTENISFEIKVKPR